VQTALRDRNSSWLSHWWPAMAFLVIFGVGICELLFGTNADSLKLAPFVLNGVVGLAVVVYVVYTHDLAQSSHVMADANLEMAKSMHSQSRQWVKDSKKQEYRTLLDTLGACIQEAIQPKYTHVGMPQDFYGQIHEGSRRRAEIQQRITAAFLEAGRVLRDRLFIEEALKKNDIDGEWRKLEQMTENLGWMADNQTSTARKPFSLSEFQQAWKDLSDRIRVIAQQDFESE